MWEVKKPFLKHSLSFKNIARKFHNGVSKKGFNGQQ